MRPIPSSFRLPGFPPIFRLPGLLVAAALSLSAGARADAAPADTAPATPGDTASATPGNTAAPAPGGATADPDGAVDPSAPPDVAEAARGYCALVEGVADAESALLLWPELFAGTGLVNGGTYLTGDDNLVFGTTLRLTAGLRYDFAGLYRGLLLKDRASAECRRHRAEGTVRLVAQAAHDVGRAEGLSARVAFLQEAVPEAEGLLARLREAVEREQATVEELYATQLRVDALRSSLISSERDLSGLRVMPRADGRALDLEAIGALVAEADRYAALVDERAAAIRESSAWSFAVRGGYDQTFAKSFDQVPLFGLLQASYNLGGLFQGEAHERARRGAEAERRARVGSLRASVQQLRRELEGAERAERRRYQELVVLERDAERRRLAMEEIPGARAQEYADYLWFEAARFKAERLYLEGRIAGLRAFLGEAPAAPAVSSAASTPVGATGGTGSTAVPSGSVGPAFNAAGRAPAALRLVEPNALRVTTGSVSPVSAERFRIEEPKVRAVTQSGNGHRASLRFRYDGPTAETAPLKSGLVRRQLGLKLRAKDGCNLVYVMWRLEPADGVVVQVKRNPGDATHAECGTDGYETVPPREYKAAPAIAPGSEHVLEATMDGSSLVVKADGETVWRGDVGEAALAFDGPAGIRTDNVRIEGSLRAGE